MYGVSQTCLRTILMTCRCDVEVIHDRHDTLFGGKLPAPNAATLIPLSNFVLDSGCDLGVATDGDADRLGVIDAAKRLLRDPSLKIGEIGEKVGYADTAHFARVFKKLTGMSANEYRNTL